MIVIVKKKTNLFVAMKDGQLQKYFSFMKWVILSKVGGLRALLYISGRVAPSINLITMYLMYFCAGHILSNRIPCGIDRKDKRFVSLKLFLLQKFPVIIQNIIG